VREWEQGEQGEQGEQRSRGVEENITSSPHYLIFSFLFRIPDVEFLPINSKRFLVDFSRWRCRIPDRSEERG
jgi:hypothetical protein